ncbi:MAG: PAS domain-containing protein, partial [Candidatus Acidiferrales bacterium]
MENHPGKAVPGEVSEAQFKKLVEVISRSQQNYRELIDHLDQAVFTLTLDGEVRVANRRLAEICNVSFLDLIGHRLSEFVEMPAPAALGNLVSEFVQTGFWEGTVPVRLKNGNPLRYFDCRLQAVGALSQDPLVTGWVRDVTAQYESEIRFAELFESLREGVYFAAPAGKILDANAAMVRLFGFDSKEDLKARNLRELYLNAAEHDALVREVESKGSFHNRELHLQRKDGQAIDCLVSAFGIRDTFGRIARLQGSVVDITEGCRIEKQLRRERDFVGRLVASFPDLIAVLDRDGRLSYVSPSVKDILGGTPREYIGERLESRADPEDHGWLADAVRRIMAGEESCARIEFRSRHVDGTQKTLRARAGPLFDEEGKIVGVVASVRDVTESRIVEQQLVQKETFAAMGQMMAGAAHELNNPLTAILGIAELLRERTADEADRRQMDVVLRQTRRAAGIVQNLLAFSRPSARGRSKVDLEEIVAHALHLEQPALSQKNISVKFESPRNLPAIDGDQKLLTRVFQNIITNAEQAISAERDYGTLTVSLSRRDNRVSVVIADDGPGISPEILGRIFDPFFTTKPPGG